MTFAEKLQYLCVERGIYANGVCQKLGFSRGAFTYWKKSGKTPNGAQLEKFAQEFEISVDEMMKDVDGVSKKYGGTIASVPSEQPVGLSKQEQEIIDIYKALPLKKQLKFLQALYKISDEE